MATWLVGAGGGRATGVVGDRPGVTPANGGAAATGEGGINGYTFLTDLTTEVAVPGGGTLSRTLHRDGMVRLVAFGFDAGQELTEHTSASEAVVQVVSGSILVAVEGAELEMGPASWLLLPPGLPHSLLAVEPSVVILTLIRPPAHPA